MDKSVEFHPWSGGRCPVSREAKVCVLLRCGEKDTCKAKILRWSQSPSYADGDIVAYSIVADEEFKRYKDLMLTDPTNKEVDNWCIMAEQTIDSYAKKLKDSSSEKIKFLEEEIRIKQKRINYLEKDCEGLKRAMTRGLDV